MLQLYRALMAAVLVAAPGVETPPVVESDPVVARRQHLERLGVARWHQGGWQGQGIKIAVLDSGFRGYRAFLGAGLPAGIQVRSFRKDSNLEARDSQHGILCAETIHAIAPQARLLLANWEPDTPGSFLEAARWARAQGAAILSCSVIMPSWSDGEGGGQLHAELTELLAERVLCCASAGNTAERHWSGCYRPDAQGRHQWQPDITRNRVVPWGSERVAVELYGAGEQGLEVQVYQATTRRLVGRARYAPDGHDSCRAVVRFEPEERTSYEVVVAGSATPGPSGARFHLTVLGANLEFHSRASSIAFPGDGAGVVAIGAVEASGQRAAYSCCGPNPRRPKPDFVASVPFPSLWRARPFAGTSAAAPQAAGLAALIWSRHPGWSARQVYEALQGAAEDLGPPGHDCETGHGLLRLPRD